MAKEQHRSRQRKRETLSGLAEKKHQRLVKYDYPLARTIGQFPDYYRVIYGDLRIEDVSPERLAELEGE